MRAYSLGTMERGGVDAVVREAADSDGNDNRQELLHCKSFA